MEESMQVFVTDKAGEPEYMIDARTILSRITLGDDHG
jgi:hypothetical protein